ncbi:outer membrane beta-barrel protein [Pseudoxanthomonas mexicana]|jgi:outer membrane protein|uniref:Outer membrane beta-barrel protein n=1 Tax=Pseudoxanthomonas mexicana TaxID=128785 RepID=A0A7G9TDQ9_PSEMX|nr:OmpW family outer membrane protein [Pseudoxanthomonas mexicana]QNN78234.1 outer membrane beta-barrel protein [Pseudoxanthomonas mexicana]WBX95177.1 outer membrane beta-barrel protein [Pseudoxanthomonas mexicana]HMM24592.1 OmpW family outer membrane protein [Pseudoxanthomonas mexicana]
MKSIRTLTIALASLIAMPALAQDATTDTTSDAASKRFAVVGGAAILKPDRDPAPGLKIDGDVAPVISASWYATPNIAVELWGAADKFNHRVRADGAGKIGTVDQQPIALSGQYHFGTADQVMRPFVGLGYYESNFSNETIGGDGAHVGLETAKGAIATAGVDFNINQTWFARADARYMKGDAGVRVAGQGTGEELTIDPWVVGVGIGARF